MSELMGKETIDTNTYGQSKGRNGSYSTNYQTAGRDLLTPDEVRMLDNKYALLFIRGERPVKDLKYDILKHPNVKYTTDGSGEVYVHGFNDYSVLEMNCFNLDEIETDESENVNYVIYSNEEIEKTLLKLEEEK